MSDQSTDFAPYHVRRAAQERRSADQACCNMVRAIHAKLARLHEKAGQP